MKLAALFSGGKDSAFAIYIAQQYGWEITHLITLVSRSQESYMFHVPNIHLTEALAEAMNIPLVKHETAGEKEEELEDLKAALSIPGIDGVLTGAIASDYQWSRINRVCYDLNLRVFSPLWRKDHAMLVKDMIDAGFEIMIVGVYAYGLDEKWLGRTLDMDAFDELLELRERYGISPAGEGGEFETLVLNAPYFKKRLVIDEMEKEWHRDSGSVRVKSVRIEDKTA